MKQNRIDVNRGKAQVLIVDDEPQILTSIADLLEDDFAVSATTDAEAALQRLEGNGVAVVVSDQRMPGLTGDEFLRRATTVSQATRILITGYTDWDALVRAVNNGQIYAYVPKPWDPMDLRMKVAKAAEHYRLQVDLAHERDLLHGLMDNMPDAIYFKDTRSRFTRINATQAALLGISNPQEALGKTDSHFLGTRVAAELLAEEQQIVASRRPLQDKVQRIQKANGQWSWYSTTKAPIMNAGNRVTGIVGISRDITERKLAEEALVRQAEELERLTYVSAHDLQEPLRTVTSFSQLLAQRYRGKMDAEADQFIDLIVGRAGRMRQLISDLLDYSRVGRRDKNFEPTDCNAALREALESLRAGVEESSTVVTSDALPTVIADSPQISQLFQNLIGNAMKFRSEEPPRVHVTVQKRPDVWVFSVRDNGIGIDPQFQERIFTVFERLHGKEKYPGTGIGLAICKRIVERHGGQIWAESCPEGGAVFCFTLPAEQPLQR